MNMLVIGNGFDLAHKRPTRYEDFLLFAGYIMRIYNPQENKAQLQKELANVSPEIKSYILNAFRGRVISQKSGQVYHKNEAIREMYECLDGNVWYDYFQAIIKENKMRGKNWIDFESEILEIIQFFDQSITDLYAPFRSDPKAFRLLPYKVRMFWSKLDFSKYYRSMGREENYYISTCLDFVEKTYQDLESLNRCLEIYLDDCVAKAPVTCYSPDIQKLKVDFVLNFNYTTIPTDIYQSLTSAHYVHGRAAAGPLKKEFKSNIVLGVNEYWSAPEKDSHTNFNCYKKFVQRIIKETGIDYKTAIEKMSSEFEKFERIRAQLKYSIGPSYNNVYFFGHSLDTTDGDILREIIQTKGIVTTIFYRNKRQQANQIANLSKVLGQNELLERVFSASPTIIFEQQADMAPWPAI